MMKMHIEATEAPHCTFSNRVRRKLTGFLRFFVFYNFLLINDQIKVSYRFQIEIN